MTQKKRGLGFNPLLGLDKSTIDAVMQQQKMSGGKQVKTPVGDLVQIPIQEITPNAYQPRNNFPNSELDELATSIKQHGVMQPILVRKSALGYELIAGERRWRASQIAQLNFIPALIRDLDDKQIAGLALVENIQRQQLSALEQARALARMRDDFNMDQSALAEMISTSRSNVANLLRLLNLSPHVQAMLESGVIEMGHARALLPLSHSMQPTVAEDIVKQRLSVRDTEALVKRLMAETSSLDDSPIDHDVSRLEEKLSDQLGARVKIKTKSGGKGQIVIEYDSFDILDGIIAKLNRKNGT